jgi:hypothetical protein
MVSVARRFGSARRKHETPSESQSKRHGMRWQPTIQGHKLAHSTKSVRNDDLGSTEQMLVSCWTF